MKLVIQRVKSAKVTIVENEEVVGQIKEGLFVLVGIKEEDTIKEAKILAEKLVKLRIMRDSQGKMNLDIKDSKASLLIVSQFTLYADTSQGNRPSFVKAAKPDKALEVYDFFVEFLKNFGVRVETGSFGNYMNISTELDGPVTIISEQ